jgi:hypothetical protein
MFFRVWYYLCFAVCPLLFLFMFLGVVLGQASPLLALVGSIALSEFIALGISGAVLAILLLFCGLRLSCPFCDRPGEVCGSKEDGMGFLCEHCGVIQGSGFLKLRLVRRWENGPPEDDEDDEDG